MVTLDGAPATACSSSPDDVETTTAEEAAAAAATAAAAAATAAEGEEALALVTVKELPDLVDCGWGCGGGTGCGGGDSACWRFPEDILALSAGCGGRNFRMTSLGSLSLGSWCQMVGTGGGTGMEGSVGLDSRLARLGFSEQTVLVVAGNLAAEGESSDEEVAVDVEAAGLLKALLRLPCPLPLPPAPPPPELPLAPPLTPLPTASATDLPMCWSC